MKHQDLDREAGARVRALRSARKMSQGDLGSRVGVTFQQVQKYEKGSNQMSAGMVVLMAKTFDVTPDFILGFERRGVGETGVIADRINRLQEPARSNILAGVNSMIAAVEATGASQP